MIQAICAFVALAHLTSQATGPMPKPSDVQPSAEYLNWSGFGFLPAGDRSTARSFRASGDWSGVQAADQAPQQDAVPWHLKVFILRRVDQIRRLADGTMYEEQCALENPDIERVLRSIQQLRALVSVETHGKLSLIPDVTVEADPVILGSQTLDEKIASYVYPRINGGSYVAEDHVFRGPFASVFCVHAVPVPTAATQTVNETLLTSISGYGPHDYDSDGLFAIALEKAWVDQVASMARQSGVLGPLKGVPTVDSSTGLANPLQFVPDDDWTSVLAGADLDAKQVNDRLALSAADAAPSREPEPKLFIKAYKGAFSDVKLDTDPERGAILTYSERGSARAGGVDFPCLDSHAPLITVAQTPTLEFWARSSSKDPLALKVVSSTGKEALFSLGRDLPGDSVVPETNLDRDGQWHPIKVDLTGTGLPDVASISLVPTSNSLTHPKITLGPIEYSFAGFQATKNAADPSLGPLQPDPDSTDPWARARWAHAASPSARLVALLKDPAWFVRLNALDHYRTTKDASVEPALIDNATLSIDGPVNALALEALWNLGTDMARATVLQAMSTGVTEPGRATAARLEATSSEPSVEKFISLTQARTIETRLAVVRALGKIPGNQSATVRMSMLIQVDPELKLEITRTLTPSAADELKELRWSAVDEPSDAVRAESDLILIRSRDAAIKEDGYKGIKDDSVGVRLALLKAFADHPDEANRAAVRIAVTDRSARVRAAALRVFAVLPNAVTLDELGTVVDDRHPIVEVSLAELARTKHLLLSKETVEALKSSADPLVRSASEGLP